jgi:hypothetical protein
MTMMAYDPQLYRGDLGALTPQNQWDPRWAQIGTQVRNPLANIIPPAGMQYDPVRGKVYFPMSRFAGQDFYPPGIADQPTMPRHLLTPITPADYGGSPGDWQSVRALPQLSQADQADYQSWAKRTGADKWKNRARDAANRPGQPQSAAQYVPQAWTPDPNIPGKAPAPIQGTPWSQIQPQTPYAWTKDTPPSVREPIMSVTFPRTYGDW